MAHDRVLLTIFMPCAALLAGWGPYMTTGIVWLGVLLTLNALLYVLSLWWPWETVRR